MDSGVRATILARLHQQTLRANFVGSSRWRIQFNPEHRRHGYLITLSARASTFGGIVRPICFAAFRLMMNSNFVRLLHREIGGLGAFQNLVHIRSGAPVQVGASSRRSS